MVFVPGETTRDEVESYFKDVEESLEDVEIEERYSILAAQFSKTTFWVGEVRLSTMVFYFSDSVLAAIGGTFSKSDVPLITAAFRSQFGDGATVWRNRQSEAYVDVRPGTETGAFRIIHTLRQRQLEKDQRAAK